MVYLIVNDEWRSVALTGFIYGFFIVFFTLLGFIIGSFLNVIIYRIPAGRSVSRGHSMCMTCGHTLGALDLVPVFSWLFLRGKCRYCGAPIASRYAKIESFTGLTFCIAAVIAAEYAAPIILWPDNLSLIFYTIYFLLFIAGCAMAISSMMILYDTGKCFTGFAVTAVVLKIFASLFPYILGFYGYNTNTLILSFEQIILTCGKIAFATGLTALLCLAVKRKYGTAELMTDIVMLCTPFYGLFFEAGNEYARTFITAAVYASVMCFMRSDKRRKYSAITAFVIFLVYMAVRFCLVKIFQ